MKPGLGINVLHNLQSQFIVRDLNSLLNAISDGDSLTLGGSICHSFRPINCTVSIPYDVVLTFGISRVFLFLEVHTSTHRGACRVVHAIAHLKTGLHYSAFICASAAP